MIDEGVRIGQLMVHDGKDISQMTANARMERRGLVTLAIFLLNIKKVGELACNNGINFVVVDPPEDVESIGEYAFDGCCSLTTVSFPTTLKHIDYGAFGVCSSLDNVDLRHTNLQELGDWAFCGCSELKSMTIPDPLQTLGHRVFYKCSKLIPSSINPLDDDVVVAHLHSKQRLVAERIKQEQNDARAHRLQQRQALQENVK